MFDYRHLIRPLLPIAAVILLCVTAAPDAHANNGPAVTSAQTTEASANTNDQQDNKQPKATQKPSQKSIFDADVLERPLSYFRNSFSTEDEEEDDLLSHSNTVIITIKALLASLLSTII